jgi:Zn-dependent protease with chaperone function
VTTGLALAGYGVLLLFPGLVLAGISGGYHALFVQPTIAWYPLLFWSAVTPGAALVTWRIAQFRPALPAGMVLDRQRAPALFELVEELGRYYRRPKIDRMVITTAFSLELVKTPCRFLPVWSANTLVIGLPLIQSLSAAQFRCALARRLGQFSKRYNLLGNWLFQLRAIWPQYCAATAGSGFHPVGWFFSVFAPLYRVISLPAARRDELAADSYAMQVCSDEEVLETITTETVYRLYLEEKYWPVFRKFSAHAREAILNPHAGIAAVLRAGLQGDRGLQWLMKAMAREPGWDDPVPSLAQRVDNIGHLETRLGEIAAVPAAAVYLGTATGELEEALGDAGPPGAASEMKPNRFVFQPRRSMDSLIRRFRSSQEADDHEQITSVP